MDTLIEPGIRPVCDVLNRLDDVRTLWSCEGHPFRTSRPYVVFEAPEQVAFQLHQMIHPESVDASLEYCWWLTANFRPDGRLQWCLEPNCHISRLRYLPFVRRKVDSELVRLAALIARTLTRKRNEECRV